MIAIQRLHNLDATVRVPGSKSLTQRALVIAALAAGTSTITHPLIADDTRCLIEALRLLGAHIDEEETSLRVTGTAGRIQNPGTRLLLDNNGTALRFLVSVAALGAGLFIIDGSERLRERPVKPLLDALAVLGVESRTVENGGCPPVVIQARGRLEGGTVTFRNAESSQYISSLLIAAPCAAGPIEIRVEGDTVSKPYIDMTMDVMKQFGVEAAAHEGVYRVNALPRYLPCDFTVEGDISSASYFFLAAALCRGKVRVENLNAGTIQGDLRVLEIFQRLGCRVSKGVGWIEVSGEAPAEGDFHFDMADIPDMVPTVAVLSAFRRGRTVISKVPHLRVKESDRIAALVTELNRIGVGAEERTDGLVIEGGSPHGAVIETYGDHRIAMSFAAAGLAMEGISIKDEECVRKSFPDFWKTLGELSE